jgi:hypothetical protein
MNENRSPKGDEPIAGFTEPLLYNLVYCSRATPDVNDASVDRILATARRMNPVYGITGLLVYGGGIFFQWLEGPRANVTELLARIQKDPRHTALVLLSESEEVRERLFPDWGMELVSATDIRDVLMDARDSSKDPRNADALDQLLARLAADELIGRAAP